MTGFGINAAVSHVCRRPIALAALLLLGMIAMDARKEAVATTVSFGLSQHTSVWEGDAGEVTVTLDRAYRCASTSELCPLYVPIRLHGDTTANGNSDFQTDLDNEGRVLFLPGEVVKTFTVTTLDDALQEPDEKVVFEFGNLPSDVTAATGTGGGMWYATVDILDDDRMYVHFGDTAFTPKCVTEYEVYEGDTFAVDISLSVNERSEALFEEITRIPVFLVPDTATAADYELVDVEAGDSSARDRTQRLWLRAVDDKDYEGDEFFWLEIASLHPPGVPPRGVVTRCPDSARVKILDNDYEVAFVESLDSEDSVATEGGAPAQVTVMLSPPAPREGIVIPLMTGRGSATDDDYSVPSPLSLTFRAGEERKSFTVTAVDDEEHEGEEFVEFNFGTLPEGVHSGTPNTAWVTIVDDDLESPYEVTFVESLDSGDSVATEGGAPAQVTVMLSPPAPREGIVIPLMTGRGSATDDDYSVPSPLSLTFRAGEERKSFTVTAVDDEEHEGEEFVEFNFGTLPEGVRSGTPNTAWVTIVDDDPEPPYEVAFVESLDSGDSVATEGGAPAQVTVMLSPPAPREGIVIPLMTGRGSATDDDYSVPSPLSVTFGAGEERKSFTVTAVDDEEHEGEEFVEFNFGTLPEDVRSGTPNTAWVTIVDDDPEPLVVSFEADEYRVMEGAEQGVSVTLSDRAPEGGLEVPLRVSHPSATVDDYTVSPPLDDSMPPLSVTVTFGPGELQQRFTITAVDDEEHEGEEFLEFSIGTLPEGVRSGTPNTARITIVDDDPEPIVVAFVTGNYQAIEGEPGGGDSAVIMVTLSPAQSRPVVIPLVVHDTPGGASEDDYIIPATVEFAPGETTRTVTVTAVDDLYADSGEVVRLAFGSLPEGITAAPGEAVTLVTLLDDDREQAAVARERQAVERTTQAIAGATLANSMANIGTRFSAIPGSGNKVVVGGRSFDPGSTPPHHLLSANPGEDWLRADGSGDADESWSIESDDLLRSGAFELSLNAAEDDMRNGDASTQWTVWGRSDFQFFESQPQRGSTYDGDLIAGYMGIDARMGDRWLVGLAASRIRTDADYGVGDDGSDSRESGRLEIDMTGILPYLRYAPDSSSEVWTILGAGSGEIDNERSDDPRETSDITMWMGAAGARRSLAPVDAIDLALTGDFGFARVETDDGYRAIDGIAVDTWRARFGLEGSHTAPLKDDAYLTSFVEVAGRYDGGSGDDEVGLEVSPGLYIASPNMGLGIEVRGRALLMHSAESYRERGLSMTASLSPRRDGLGLSLSLSPRWGAPTGDAETLWRDNALESLGAIETQGDSLSFDARAGYGLRSMNGLLTPFGEFGLRDGDGRRVRVGAQFTRRSTRSGALDVELSGERRDSAWDDSEHRVGVIGRLRF